MQLDTQKLPYTAPEMTTFLISHRSTFVAYLVAAAIRLYFRQRTIHIVIVEIFDKNNLALRPWCGVSALSNLRMQFFGFLSQSLLGGVLGNAVRFVDSIHIKENPRSFSPESPGWAQASRLVAHVNTVERFLAVFYHPTVVVDSLRRYLTSPNVSFMSVQNENGVAGAVRAIQNSQNDVYWIDFPTSPGQAADIGLLVHSSVTSVEYLGGAGPPAILWLPLFRAAANMFSEPIFSSALTKYDRITKLSVKAINLSDKDTQFALQYDLVHALKACDYVLQTVDSMAASERLDITPYRL